MRGYPERTLATRAKWLLDTRDDVEVSLPEWLEEMEATLKELANAPQPEPVAHAVIMPNGMTRVWFIDKERGEQWRKEEGIKQELTPLYTAPPAPSVPVLTVECEPDYWSGGHYHEGTMPYIDPTAVWKLPIGTELYTSPPANNQSEQHLEMVNAPAPSVPDADLVIDLKHVAYDALTAAAMRSKWIPPEYVSNDWIADCINFLENGHPAVPADMVRDAAPDIWRVMCGDWREETVAIHNSEGWIADGLDLKKAAALVKAHNGSLGLGVAAIERDKKGGAA